MKFSFALATALFLSVPVNAQDSNSEPSSAHDITAPRPASSIASTAPASTVPESKPESSLRPSSTASYSVPTSTSTTRTPSSAYPTVPSTTSKPTSSYSVPTSTSTTMSSSSASHAVLSSTITTRTANSAYPTVEASTTTARLTSSTYPTVKTSTTTAKRPSSTYPAVPPPDTTQISVQVAPGGQLTYDPPSFEASNGTVVTFSFSPASGHKRNSNSHSITQGSFAHPCVYLAAAGGKPAGFDSGLQTGGQFSINITNDQQPIWFFCKRDKHCGQGMVGAINARPKGETYDAYLAAAKALGQNQNTLSDNGPVMGGLGATVLAMGIPSPTASATSSSISSSSSHIAANGFFALLAAAFGMTLALA